jgi:hypothetical protein
MSNANTIYNHGARASGSDTYYSPIWVIDKLPIIFRGADYFDPCPGNLHNHIKAPVTGPMQLSLGKNQRNIALNAFGYPWYKTAPFSYVNPPFSMMSDWIEKAAKEAIKGHISLWFTKFDLRTQWGKDLIESASWVVPKLGYVHYLNEYGQENNSATFQTAFALFCQNPDTSRIIYSRVVRNYPDLWVPRLPCKQ